MNYDDIPDEALQLECLVCREQCVPIAEGDQPKNTDEEAIVCWMCDQQKGEHAYLVAQAVLSARRRGLKEVRWSDLSKGDVIHYITTDWRGPRLSKPVIVADPDRRICEVMDGVGFFGLYHEEVVFVGPGDN